MADDPTRLVLWVWVVLSLLIWLTHAVLSLLALGPGATTGELWHATRVFAGISAGTVVIGAGLGLWWWFEGKNN